MYLKRSAGELAAETGHEDLEQMADVIERIVTTEKKLPPNLDWPSARLYHYLGLPVGALHAAVRRQPRRRLERPRHRAARQQPPDPPRARYTGPASRKFTPLAQRG